MTIADVNEGGKGAIERERMSCRRSCEGEIGSERTQDGGKEGQ